jgi:soluble lytic murein transglycosylase-like protein
VEGKTPLKSAKKSAAQPAPQPVAATTPSTPVPGPVVADAKVPATAAKKAAPQAAAAPVAPATTAGKATPQTAAALPAMAADAAETKADMPPAKPGKPRRNAKKTAPAVTAEAVTAVAPAPAAIAAPAEKMGRASTTQAVADPSPEGKPALVPAPPVPAAPFARKRATAAPAALAFASPETPPELRTSVTPGSVPAATTMTTAAVAAAAAPGAPLTREGLNAMVARYAKENGIPYELAHGVVMVESRYNPKVTGPGGHVGLMQISYPTAKSLGFTGTRAGLYDPEVNLTYGMKYLGAAYRLAAGSMCGAVSKYQGGHRVNGITKAGAAYCAKVRAVNAAHAKPDAKAVVVTADAVPSSAAPATTPAARVASRN